MNHESTAAARRILTSVLLVTVALLAGSLLLRHSLYLGAIRSYHADECRNVFMARVLATDQAEQFHTSTSLYLLPLSWLAGGATQSADLFASARIVSFLTFWLNLVLIALATGARLGSRRWFVALLGVATLSPLWDFGLEIRPDNLLLTGMLLTWCALRVHPAGFTAYLMAGAIAMAMQFTSAMALAFTVPVTIAIWVFPPSGKLPRWKLISAWAAGAVTMAILVRLVYGAAGIWQTHATGFLLSADVFGKLEHFGLWKILSRLLLQTPLLLVMLASALVATVADLRQRGKVALTWDGNLPEALLCLLAFLALTLNPSRRPPDLIYLVAFAFLFAFRYAATIIVELWQHRTIRPLIVTLLLFAHLMPFGIATRRHQGVTNFRQAALMGLAEGLTNPAKDMVYDGLGMVPTRASVGFRLLVPGQKDKPNEKGDSVGGHGLLAKRPAAVFISNYLTDSLGEADQEFVRGHYVALADDFWVLGKKLPPGGGAFEVIHPGRYQISPKEASCILGTVETNPLGLVIPPVKTNCVGRLDGIALTGKPVELAVGTHRVETATDCEPAVVWVGPRSERLKPLNDNDHLLLFINWH